MWKQMSTGSEKEVCLFSLGCEGFLVFYTEEDSELESAICSLKGQRPVYHLMLLHVPIRPSSPLLHFWSFNFSFCSLSSSCITAQRWTWHKIIRIDILGHPDDLSSWAFCLLVPSHLPWGVSQGGQDGNTHPMLSFPSSYLSLTQHVFRTVCLHCL